MADVSKGTYSPNVGIGISPNPVRQPRNPTTLDVNYPIDQLWVNTSSQDIYFLASFTSTSGTVLANWKAQAGIDSVTVDASTSPGTNPVLPSSSGSITVTGAQVASAAIGANVIKTNSLTANTYTVQIQQAGESASQDTTLNGVCHFDSTHFNISNGFVSLSGGGMAVDSFTPDTGTTPVVPSGTGNIALTGQTPANVSGIQVTGGLNSLALSMFSPFKGDFTFTESIAGNSEFLTVSHTDNTAANNGAALIASVAGTTQTGDPYNLWAVGSTRSYALGPDTSDSQTIKLTTTNAATVTPSTGTTIFQSTSAGIASLPQSGSALYIGTSSPANPVDLNIEKTEAGGNTEIEVRNLSNTASSNSLIGIVVGGTSANDPFITYNIPVTTSWSHGIDNSVSGDPWKLAASNILGLTDVIIAATIGSVIKPLQPAFAAYLSASTTNDVTGDGTVYTVICNTENGDQQSNYNSGTGTFTCPTTGLYLYTWYVTLQNLDVVHTSGYNHVSGSVDIRGTMLNVGAVRDSSNTCTISVSALVFTTATNTVNSKITVSGGTKTVGITGGLDGDGAPYTYFTAALIC